MTTRRAPRRSQPAPKPEPEDVRIKKARKLPMFGPGIVITVPLSLLPEYLALYQLQPTGCKPSGILLVKRTPNEAKPRTIMVIRDEHKD